MFYIYIIYSESADKYYIGHTNDPSRRLEEHNTEIKNSFTFKFRPWILKGCFPISQSRRDAIIIEKYLKKMKSRILIENLVNSPECFEEILKRVRAIPTCRD
ncbi:MAG TPA: GIY-YIG nuclease family protein [Bacteroidales bacterium]